MKKFKELFEAKEVTPSQVKKVIQKIDFSILLPDAFEVDLFNTDAGMGGEKVVRVLGRNLRTKDMKDVALLKSELSKKFSVTDKSDKKDHIVYIIRKG